MKKNLFISVFSVLICSAILGVGCWYLYKYFKRHTILQMQKDHDRMIDHEIAELQALGFDEESEAIGALKSRYSQYHAATKQIDRNALSDLLSLNKKMLMSYIAEGKCCKKQNIDSSSNLMKFIQDKIVRLTIAVVELERQLQENELQASEYEKRVQRMQEITRQSVQHYKKTLRDYQQMQLASHDERVKAAQSLLTTRLKHLTALHHALS
jgi:phage-related minor tail protein